MNNNAAAISIRHKIKDAVKETHESLDQLVMSQKPFASVQAYRFISVADATTLRLAAASNLSN